MNLMSCGMVIEMWPELDGFGEEKPSDKKKEVQCVKRSHVSEFRRCVVVSD